MVRRSLTWCFVLFVVTAAVGVTFPAPAHATSAGAIIDAVNAERASRGLPTLQTYGDTTMAIHANDVFVETGEPHGARSTVAAWYLDGGADSFRENQANFPTGQTSAGAIVAAWLISDDHAANLLAADATHIVAAVRASDGRTYVTVHVLTYGSAAPPSDPDDDEDDEEAEDEPAPAPAPEPQPDPEPEPVAPADPEPAPEEAPADEPEAVERDLSALRAPVPEGVTSRRSRHPAGTEGEPYRHPAWDPPGDVEVAPQILTSPDDATAPGGGDAVSAAAGEGDGLPLRGLVPGAAVVALLATFGIRLWGRRAQ